MRKFLSLMCLLAVVACSKGNSKVTDQGNVLAPKSGVFFSGTVFFFSIGGVVITDAPGACDTITKSIPAGSPCNAASSPLDASPLGSATTLTILSLPAAQGTFNVVDPNAKSDGGARASSGAFASFSKSENGKSTFSDTAVGGTVTFDHFEVGKSASGSYDLTMQSGAHLSGSFDASDCAALDAALDASVNGQRSCGASGGSADSCSGECSCKGQTVKASCSGPSDGGSGDWTCTCTDAAGATTTCTQPHPSTSLSACEQHTSCCPLAF